MKKNFGILLAATLALTLPLTACSSSSNEESRSETEYEQNETLEETIRDFSTESEEDTTFYQEWRKTCTQDSGSYECTLMIEKLTIDSGPSLISGDLPPLFLDGMLACRPTGAGFAGVKDYACTADLGVTNRSSSSVDEHFSLTLWNYKDFYSSTREPHFSSPLNPDQTKAFVEAPIFEITNLDKFPFLTILGQSEFQDSYTTNLLRLCRVIKPSNQDLGRFEYKGYSNDAIIFENCLRLNYWDYDFEIPITIDPCRGECRDGNRWARMDGFHPRGFTYQEWQVELNDEFVNNWS